MANARRGTAVTVILPLGTGATTVTAWENSEVSLPALVAVALPWPDERFLLAALVVCAGLAFGAFYTPGMTLVTQAAEARGLEYGYAFALINLAWAPGQTGDRLRG